MWAGPRSPLFGKDRMATFETYFVADKATHKETKNPYFELIHDAPFCRRIAAELGGSGDVLIVNGHVPVKLEQGEAPLKRSGLAVTIDDTERPWSATEVALGSEVGGLRRPVPSVDRERPWQVTRAPP